MSLFTLITLIWRSGTSSIFIYFLLQEHSCWWFCDAECCEHLTCDSQSNSRVSVIKKRVVGCCEAKTKLSRVTLCQVPDCQSAHLVGTSVRHTAWKLRDICQVLILLIIWSEPGKSLYHVFTGEHVDAADVHCWSFDGTDVIVTVSHPPSVLTMNSCETGQNQTSSPDHKKTSWELRSWQTLTTEETNKSEKFCNLHLHYPHNRT